MRLLVFCDEDLGTPGGGSRQVLELVVALVARGNHVQLVAPRTGRLPNLLPARVLWIPRFEFPILRPLSYFLLSSLVVLGALILRRPDAVLWFDSPGQIGPLLGALITRRPYVLFVNGLPQEELRGLWRRPPVMAYLIWALRRAVRHAAAVVSVSEEILAWLQQTCGVEAARCHVVKNGVDPDRFRPLPAEESRQALGLEPERPYVGFIGGFFPWHGLHILIQAVPIVLQAMPRTRFLLVGDGQSRAEVETLANQLGVREACVFPGRVPLVAVPTWIAACDVCVVLYQPTRSYPGDSMKLWEYLGCARPVVTVPGPGYGDVVEEMGSGLSVKVNDPQDLAQALVCLLRDADERHRMGQRGRRGVERSHTWQVRAAALESVLLRANRFT